MDNRLEISGDSFVYNGKPVRIISGAIHYFRIVPECWRDRLLKLKACGFNTVETYIPWNLHEPMPGVFNFTGMADLKGFLEIVRELGLWAILRPSPYICAEWEMGGLPSWLLAIPDIHLRCFNKAFLDRVDAYYDVLIPVIRPYLSTKGGPVIAMQVENEYGSYGNDKAYLSYLRQALEKREADVLLFTSDGPTDLMLKGGTLDKVLKTVNFGSKPEEALLKLREHQKEGPLMCGEFWDGWFDHWGEAHHTRDAVSVAWTADRILEAGASVNFYMFCGGTNFGFYNGANFQDKYEPTVTSYDYDALLSESGDPTDKYYSVREVVKKYNGECNNAIIESNVKKQYGKVKLTGQACLFDVLDSISAPVQCTCPEPMEKLGQNYGFILYETYIEGPLNGSMLEVCGVHDRAIVYLDGKCLGVIDRRQDIHRIPIMIPEGRRKLSILVENMGRVNYGPHLWDLKGITEGVKIDYQFLYGWTVYPLPLGDISKIPYSPVRDNNTASFYRGTFFVDSAGDTFADMEGWTKGVVFINGFNLGRYWEIGPQKTLYIPAPLLKPGINELVVFELHGTADTAVTLQKEHILG